MNTLLTLVLLSAAPFTDEAHGLSAPFSLPFAKSEPEVAQVSDGTAISAYRVQSGDERHRQFLAVRRITRPPHLAQSCEALAASLGEQDTRQAFDCNDAPVSSARPSPGNNITLLSFTADRCVDDLGHVPVRVRAWCEVKSPTEVTVVTWGATLAADDDADAQRFMCGVTVGGRPTCAASCDVSAVTAAAPAKTGEALAQACEVWPASVQSLLTTLGDVGPEQPASFTATALDVAGGPLVEAVCPGYSSHFRTSLAMSEAVKESQRDEVLATALFRACGFAKGGVWNEAEAARLAKSGARGFGVLAPFVYQRLLERGVEKTDARRVARQLAGL